MRQFMARALVGLTILLGLAATPTVAQATTNPWPWPTDPLAAPSFHPSVVANPISANSGDHDYEVLVGDAEDWTAQEALADAIGNYGFSYTANVDGTGNSVQNGTTAGTGSSVTTKRWHVQLIVYEQTGSHSAHACVYDYDAYAYVQGGSTVHLEDLIEVPYCEDYSPT